MVGYKVYYDRENYKFTISDEPMEVEKHAADACFTFHKTREEAERVLTEKNNNLHCVHICKDCGEPFWISEENAQWYKDQGFQIPIRCSACRKARKNGGNSNEESSNTEERERKPYKKKSNVVYANKNKNNGSYNRGYKADRAPKSNYNHHKVY